MAIAVAVQWMLLHQAVLGVGSLLLVIVAWQLFSIFYNLILSPLSRFPGPKLWAISHIPCQLSILRGHAHLDVLALHERYGPVLRIGPNALTFNTAQAWRDMHGFRPNHKAFLKDERDFVPAPNGVRGLTTSVDIAVHARQRRLLNPAFTERSIKGLEGLVTVYVDTLIAKLREQATMGKGKLDIKSWFNYTIFDITGDLVFGEPFGSLREGELHPWIELIFNSVKMVAILGATRRFPLLSSVLRSCIPKSNMQKRLDHFRFSVEKVDRRLDLQTDRPDVISAILKNGLSEKDGQIGNDERAMSRAEIHANAFSFTIVGSETTATLLSGCIFYLCKNPSIMTHLTKEVRAAFSSDDQITFTQTAGLPYLNAVIQEGLRIYPPLATSLGRVAPLGGESVSGHWIPENTSVYCHHYASYHSPSNFTLPEEFIPERWLGSDPRFKNDKKDVFNPFGLGPHGCLGKDLAYAEIRLVLAKLLFHFEIELCPESANWTNQEVYIVWDKPPLMVTLKEQAGG